MNSKAPTFFFDYVYASVILQIQKLWARYLQKILHIVSETNAPHL